MADMNLTVEKLNDFNYEVWEFRIDLLLIREGLSDVVKNVKPATPDATWISKDGKARAIIGLSIEDGQLCHVINAATARDMWEALQKHHNRSTLATKVHVLRKLMRMQLTENSNMADHLAEISRLSNRLSSMGEPLKECLLVAIILSSLSDSYDGLITALESRPEAELTLEFIQGKLLDEWRKRVEKSDAGTGVEKVFKSNERTKTEKIKVKACHYCGKEGHYRRDCRKLMLDRKARGKEEEKKVEKVKSNHKANIAVVSDDEEVCLAAGVPVGDRCEAMWYLDSGATSHMTCDKRLLDQVDASLMNIGLADGSSITATGVGSSKFSSMNSVGKTVTVTLKQVYYVPSLTSNLLSISKITDEGFTVEFQQDGCTISKCGKIVLTGRRSGNLYHLKSLPSHKTLLTVGQHNENCIHTWHRRLGHRNEEAVRKIIRNELGTGLKLRNCGIKSVCGVCCEGKMARAPFISSTSKSSAVGDLIHSDLCRPMEVSTPRGSRYFMTMLDDYSRYCVVYLLKEKSECAEKIMEYTIMMRNQFGHAPKVIRSDGGGEYSGKQLQKFLGDNGILLQQSAPYSPQQNGRAERKNRSLGETMRCLLSESGLDKRFWGEAVTTGNFLLNISPSSVVEGTPFERWWGKKPDYSSIRVFGSKAYVHIPDEKRRKLDAKARKLVFVGYAEGRKAWRFLDTETNRITVSRDAKFLESSCDKEEAVADICDLRSGTEVTIPVVPTNVINETDCTEETDLEEADTEESSEFDSASESNFEGFPDDELHRRSRRVTKGVPPRRFIDEINIANCTEDEPRNWNGEREVVCCYERGAEITCIERDMGADRVTSRQESCRMQMDL